MKRKTFVTIVAPLAALIGIVALFYPSVLLESKGVNSGEPVKVWMSEVGILLISTGIVLFLVRKEQVSIALKAIFFGNIIIQIGLLTIEILAYQNGVIKEVSGIIPNSILHILLLFGFTYYLVKMTTHNKVSCEKP
ncbi:hypothetical protein [Flagellimonas sp.]|uniref:hypothetical protein n=1 Tax=Flagellimonas sp. TaxID=2058762 RepID=UPI003BA990D8